LGYAQWVSCGWGKKIKIRVAFLSCTVSLANAKKWCYQINQFSLLKTAQTPIQPQKKMGQFNQSNSKFTGVSITPLQSIQIPYKNTAQIR